MFSNDNHLHHVTYELNGLRSLLSEILFYFVFFATVYLGIQIGRFIFNNILHPMSKNDDLDALNERLQMVEQATDALISHLNRLREEQVNVFESAPTHVSHPTTPVRQPKESSTPEGRRPKRTLSPEDLRPKKRDIEKAIPESTSVSDSGDSAESEESKKDV